MKSWNSWESLGLALIMLWFFFAGYMTAIGFGVLAMSWSVRDVTLYFPDGGMTGHTFVALFNIAQWAFVILTVAVVCYVAYSITLSALTQKEAQ